MQHLQMDGTLKLKPYWKDAWTVKSTSGKTLILVPAPENHIDNKDISIRRFFIFGGNGTSVNNGTIVELLGVKYDVNDQFDFLLKNYDRDNITGFNGDIIQYDLNYHLLSTSSFKKGIRTNNLTTIESGSAILNRGVVFGRPGLKTNTTCEPITPINIGFPATFCTGGTIYYSVERAYDGQCITSEVRTYMYTVCPGSSSGSNGSGSGSGSGSNSGGVGGPPYGGVVVTVGDADHRLPNSNKLPPSSTTDTQFPNLCVFKSMEWVAKYFDSNATEHSILQAYCNSKVTDGVTYGAIFLNVVQNGINSTEVPALVSKYFNYTESISTIESAINAGHPLLASILVGPNSGHEVMITGYNDDGTIEYFDPQIGTYFEKQPNQFYNLIEITSKK
ncbi:hypothetical protein GCM10023313_03820 [Mucilaginibacter defluvii]|uniref:Peptidase C39-like domain-containing protein n=2 Tax=Mucilaginibacter defluvii TaxID=1196019 RepID=A0ABP9FLZ4_9SPHI